MARQVGDETVILDLSSGLYFGLDPVGSRMWELIGSGLAFAAICDTLLGEYDVQKDRLVEDLRRLVDELTQRGLLAGSP